MMVDDDDVVYSAKVVSCGGATGRQKQRANMEVERSDEVRGSEGNATGTRW